MSKKLKYHIRFFPILAIIFILVALILVLSSCSLLSSNGHNTIVDGHNTIVDEPYFGTWHNALWTDVIKIDSESIDINGDSYRYTKTEHLLSIDSENLTFRFFEKDSVMCLMTYITWSTGSIPTREGYFDSTVTMMLNSTTISYAILFHSDGTYQFVSYLYNSKSHSGTYTLHNGVLILNGRFNINNAPTKEYYYVADNLLTYMSVFLKDESAFVVASSPSKNESRSEEHQHTIVTDPAIEPTCTTPGKTEGSHCSVCGEVIVAQRELPTSPSSHSYGEWIVQQSATCMNDGMQYRYCVDCNTIDRQTLKATGHNGDWKVIKQPSCTAPGKRETTCAICGILVAEAIAPLGHDYGEWETTIQPTCGVGQQERYCARCDAKENKCLPSQIRMTHTYNANDVCTTCGEHRATIGLQYRINDNTASISGYDGSDSVIYIPAEYAGAMVTRIDEEAFYQNTSIVSITLPDSIISIENHAFFYCSGLTSITIPNGVTSIETLAFYNCSKLTSITIPDSVTSIGDYAFCGCSGLTSVTILAGVTSIGNYTFDGCSRLTSITIPESVTSIGENAFYNCSKLTSITIPDSVTSIGNYAFCGCNGLTSVTFAEGSQLPSIEVSAFVNCTGLTGITIPEGVTSIGDYAFCGCSGLTSVTIPASVTSIGAYAFKGCYRLEPINYQGTTDQWTAISIDENLGGRITIHCTDGDIKN